MNIKSLLSVTALASLMFATGCNTMYAKERDYNSVGQPTDSYAKQLSYASGYNFYYKTGLDDVKVSHEDYEKIQKLEGQEFTETGINGIISDGNNAAIVNFSGTMFGGAGFGLGLSLVAGILSAYTETKIDSDNSEKFPIFVYQDMSQGDQRQAMNNLMTEIASAMIETLKEFSYQATLLDDYNDDYKKTEFENLYYLESAKKYITGYGINNIDLNKTNILCQEENVCIFGVGLPAEISRVATVPRIIPNIANEKRYIYDKIDFDNVNNEPVIIIDKRADFSTSEFIYKLSTKLPDWIYIVNRGHHDNVNKKQWIPPMIFNHGKVHFFVVDKDAENK